MLTIAVDGQLEDRLRRSAMDSGADPQSLARQVLDEYLPRSNEKTIRLLAEWEARNATTDVTELRRRQAEGEALMKSLASNRTEFDGPEARLMAEIRAERELMARDGVWITDDTIREGKEWGRK